MEDKQTFQPVASMPKRDVVYGVEMVAGCSWYRCTTPSNALNDLGYNTIVTDKITKNQIAAADVVVLLRPGSPHSLKNVAYAKQMRKKLIIDFDDDLWSISRDNPAWSGWNNNNGHHLNILAENMKSADLVTTTTDELVQLAKKFNKNVIKLPNMLPDEYWENPKITRDPDYITIGWAGSTSHVSDIRVILSSVTTILNKYPNVKFAFAGLRPDIPHDRVVILPPVPIEEYPSLLGTFDIALAAITDTRFNRAKSDLKYIESAAVGSPIVASKVSPYFSVKAGETGFLAQHGKDWVKYLSLLIENEDLRIKMGKAAREYAETRFISKNIHLWESAYGLQK